MRSKDRLAELQLLAEGAAVYRDTTVEDAPKQPPPDIDHVFQEVECMRTWIHELNGNTQLLRRLYADPSFHVNKQLQEQLDAVVAASGAVGLRVCGALRSLEGAVSRPSATGAGASAARNDAAARIARLQYATTRALYADALAAHHAALAAVRDHQRDLLHEQIKLTNLTISDEECESLLDSKNLSLFVDNVEAETAEARRVLRDVEARHEGLVRMEASLRDVHALFQQLALLVAAQQEQVDSVEYYALQASEHVECGGHQLLKGTVSRTKARKNKMSLIICLVVGSLVVLLVLVCT